MLRTRLYLGLLPLLLLFIVVGLAAMFLSREVSASIEQNLVANYRAVIGSYDMRDAATLMASALYAAQRGDPLAAQRDYADHRARFQRNFMEQAQLAAGTDRTVLLQELDDAFIELDNEGHELLADGDGASFAVFQDIETRLFKIVRSLERLTQRDYAEVQEAAKRTTRLVRLSNNLLAGAMIGAILLCLFLSYRLARSLLGPIQTLTASAAAFGEGRFEQDVAVNSNDELGELARTFNAMAAKLRAYRDAMNERVTLAHRTMEAMLTSTPDPLFVISREGRHEMRNPAAERLMADAEVPGWPPALAEPLAEVFATGRHYLPTGYDRVVSLRTKNEEQHFLPRILAIGDELTGFGGAALILQDVTKFRLLDDVKNNLVSTVSHELKTPLTSLRMAVYLLLEHNFGPLEPRQRDLLETARTDADRLLRILNDLLDLNRLEAGMTSLICRDVPVAALLEEIVQEMRPITEAARQTLAIERAEETDCVYADAERLRHVFTNFLSNASKYSPEGSRIVLSGMKVEGGQVRFAVRDEGPGIPPEALHRVFDKFYRVPGEEKKGAGLGLAIAREIVTAHGGTIGVEQPAVGGSEFFFTVPVRSGGPAV